jgi:hypothetical protein
MALSSPDPVTVSDKETADSEKIVKTEDAENVNSNKKNTSESASHTLPEEPMASTVVKKIGFPTKRSSRGRPPRAIKKPRKYLEGMNAEENNATEPSETEGEDARQAEELQNDDATGADCKEKEVDGGKEEEEEEHRTSQANVGSEDGKLKICPQCGKQFTSVSNCQRHIASGDCSPDDHTCLFCQKTFR